MLSLRRGLFPLLALTCFLLPCCPDGFGLLPTSAVAQKKADAPYVKLPATKTERTNFPFRLTADTNCKGMKWTIPAGLFQPDPDLFVPVPNSVVLFGDTGTYTIKCFGSLNDVFSEEASCVITVGTPPPGPGPGPTPAPTDPLVQAFQAGYNLDTDADKATSLQFLQGVYAGMAAAAPSWTDVKTNADALVKIKAVVQAPQSGLTAKQIVSLRKAIAIEMVKVFGTDGTAAIQLPALAAELDKIAGALKGVLRPQAVHHAKGLRRRPDKDFLMRLSDLRHRALMKRLMQREPPPSWDSRTKGWVGPIKDQSQCGSCWDFSGTFVVEAAMYKAGALKPDGSDALSEQYTLDCGRNGGCSGDDNVTVLQWAKQTGLPKTSAYGPYHARAGRCQYSNQTLYKINDWGFADGSGRGVTSAAAIKAAIMEYGVVGCAVDAGFRDPGQGVISGSGHNIDHDVALVGWDDSKGRSGAWIMRNSWGTSWADGGYAWIEYGAFDIGTEAVWAVVTPVNTPIDWWARLMRIDAAPWLLLAA